MKKKNVKRNGDKNLTKVNEISEISLKEITEVIKVIFSQIVLEMTC